jgi:hypothetical protein
VKGEFNKDELMAGLQDKAGDESNPTDLFVRDASRTDLLLGSTLFAVVLSPFCDSS